MWRRSGHDKQPAEFFLVQSPEPRKHDTQPISLGSSLHRVLFGCPLDPVWISVVLYNEKEIVVEINHSHDILDRTLSFF